MSVKRKIHPVAILLLGLLFLVPQNLYSQESGYKYFKNYSYNEYDHLPQNWGIAQDKDGIIYVANHGGVLIYDGVSWRVMGIPNYATVRSLAIDETGTVYIGGVGQIGYLKSNERGYLQYVSLMDQLEKAQRNFSDVWRTVATKEGIYFSSSNFLFRWDPKRKQIKVWKPTHRFLHSFKIKGKLLIHQHKVGLMQMVNDSLELLPRGEIFAEAAETIFMVVPYGTGDNSQTLLIGTRLKGFFLYYGKTVVPFPTEVDDYLKENKASYGIRLSSGGFALATRGGLVIMDSHGHFKYVFNKKSGLQSNNVRHIFEDLHGGLWMSLDKGISKLEYSSPFFFYDDRSDLPGIVLSMSQHKDNLYVGTTQGLYVLRSDSKIFQPIPGMSSICWSLLSIKNPILAATQKGVFLVDSKNDMIHNIIKSESFVLLPSRLYPGRIWCGTRSGLVTLVQKNGRWVEKNRFKSINQPIHSMSEDDNGNLWMVTLTDDVIKVDFAMDIMANSDPPIVTKYSSSHDLPGGRVYVAEAAGHVMFATDNGLFRFDEKNKKFIPDITLGTEFAGGPHSRSVFRLVEDKDKNIWFHSKSMNYQAIPWPGGSYGIYPNHFRRIPMAQVNTIYPDPDGKNIWFGSNEGLVRYDKTVKKNYRQNFQTLIRRVIVNEKWIFDGYKNKTSKTSKDIFPIFQYKDRNIHFEFAAPFFEAETETQYQYFLEGYDDGWSAWNKDYKRYYTNLDPGLYVFRVRARNVYGYMSNAALFQFKILLPWYRTWWAFLSYTFLLFILTYLIVKWQRSIRLEKEKQRMEQIINERTEEIEEKKQQLEKQTIQLKEQAEKLKEMDKVKSRFFANISHEFRTPLTLIMGPMEQMLIDSRDKTQKEQLDVMLQNSQRLLKLINQLLALSRIDSGKMNLQASRQDIISFLEGILTTFQVLAQHNQLELEFYSKEEKIILYFDTEKMEEVMTNLLINAIKFTPAQGKITVSVSRNEGDERLISSNFVEVSVKDTGIGIPKDQLPHIFDRFYQVERSISGEKGYTGTGIGLALTKELVELHQGRIDVKSEEGKGAEFIVRLPMGKEHLQPHEIVTAPEIPLELHKFDKIPPTYMIEKMADAEDENDKRHELKEKNIILVIDDNSLFRKYIRGRLKFLYKIAEAVDGQDGIDKAKKIIPDLIISDVMMPGIDGYELCNVLKKDVTTSHIPVILLTAKASEESIIHGLETGADDYITKPFNTKILIARIKNLIELRRQLQIKLQKQEMLPSADISVSSIDEAFLKDFRDIIEKNLSNPDFNEDQLCLELHMSQGTLTRKIQALTGKTPNQYINSYRLERAAQLLKTNFGSVTAVAFKVGFSSAALFAKLFKEKFHQLPTSFQTSGSQAKSSRITRKKDTS